MSKATEIDLDRLDEEWVNQPASFYEYAIQLADAKLKHANAKSKLDVVTAELDILIRSDPNYYNLDKVTEKALEKVVMIQPSYQKAVKAINESKHTMDVLQAMVDALDHKKKALENLVHLHSMNYFSSPRSNKDTHETVGEMEHKAVFGKNKKRSKS